LTAVTEQNKLLEAMVAAYQKRLDVQGTFVLKISKNGAWGVERSSQEVLALFKVGDDDALVQMLADLKVTAEIK
jgi:hypothetical protein